MVTFIIAGIVFLMAMAAMAVGVIVSNRRIQGSCGGLANLQDSHGNPMCESCTRPSTDCDGRGMPEATAQDVATAGSDCAL